MLFTVFVTNSILSSKNTKTNGINTPIEHPAILAFLLFIPFKSSILFDVSFDLIALSIALFNATTFELLLLIYFFSPFIVISFGLSVSLFPPNTDLNLFLQAVIKKFNIIISSLLRLTLLESWGKIVILLSFLPPSGISSIFIIFFKDNSKIVDENTCPSSYCEKPWYLSVKIYNASAGLASALGKSLK